MNIWHDIAPERIRPESFTAVVEISKGGKNKYELDKETGEVKVVDYAACVDCGTPINPNLTRVQTEGGILQGIGMALTENITYDAKGWPMENSFMQYKIPARVDIGHIRVEFESSYEPNGPFGAKSIGEVVINTPLPAIADAIYNAIGTRFYELPETQFPFLAEKGHVVSLVGGGGKTTLLYAFARHCAAKGWRVLVSTTTHIRQPGENYAADEAALASLWAAGRYAVAGVPAEQGKLTALPPEQLTRWMERADMVLLEADGAKRMPCKVPAAHEPVLLPESDIVLAVAGLSALGRPLREVCFRLEQACALLGAAPETLLTPELLARLLASEQGGRKLVGNRRFSVVLNQADAPARIAAGEQTLALLRKKYEVQGVLTYFDERERA